MRKYVIKVSSFLCILCIFSFISSTSAKAAEQLNEDTTLSTSLNSNEETQKYQIGDYIDGLKIVDVQSVSFPDTANLNAGKQTSDITPMEWGSNEFYYENYNKQILEGERESYNIYPPGTPSWTYTVQDSYTVAKSVGVSNDNLEATLNVTIENGETRTLQWTGDDQETQFALLIYPVYTHIWADIWEDDVWFDDFYGRVHLQRISGYNIYLLQVVD